MRRVGITLALLALVAGCSFVRGTHYDALNECNVDVQCTTGICFEGVCAAEPAAPMRVVLQVITAPSEQGRAPASSVLPPITIETNERRDLTTAPLTRLSGRVRYRDQRVPAVLSFYRPSKAPGIPEARVEVETGDPLGDGSVDYLVSVTAGESLSLEVRVAGSLFASVQGAPELDETTLASRQLPPLYFPDLVFDPGQGTFDITFSPTLFEPCADLAARACEVSGTLTSVGLDDTEAPVSGVEIRAVDPATGRAVSSTAQVVDGQFALRLSPDFLGDYDLQVIPALSGSPYRATTFPAASLAWPLELQMRRYPIVHYEALVLDAETGAPVPLATVSFQSAQAPDPISGAPAFYRTTTLSGEGEDAGRIRVELQPGTFTVVITPLETQDLAIRVDEVIIPDAEGLTQVLGQAFELERRAELALFLRGFDGAPIDLVEVQASPRAQGSGRGAAVVDYARSSVATTDRDGLVDLPIDLGVFDLFARPAATRGYPYAVATAVPIDAPASRTGHELVVPAPTVLAGTLLAEDGLPLAEATLRAFVEVEGDGEPRIVRLGETTSDAKGAFRLLLPSER